MVLRKADILSVGKINPWAQGLHVRVQPSGPLLADTIAELQVGWHWLAFYFYYCLGLALLYRR